MPVAPDLCGSALDGRYELHAVIGEGAFGRVYRGVDRRLARPVAVKVIKPWWAEDPDWVGSFEREAQLLARVSDPGIVQIYDVGHADEGLYYVSELVEGESLARRLARGSLEAWDAAALAEQLCRALAHAHARRIIHRDVKPANILISAGGHVKVGDFGVARLAEGSTDGALATVVGTPRYMAPEQGRGRRTSPATDVYSVGVVLYEMLAGEPPFTGTSVVELALSHDRESPPPLPARVPAELSAIAMRALAKAPADRYRDAGEMAQALAAARRAAPRRPAPPRRPAALSSPSRGPVNGHRRGGSPVERTRLAPPSSPPRRWNPAARRRTIAAFVVVLAVLAGLVIAAVLVGNHRQVTVPALGRLSRGAITERAHRAGLRVRFRAAYSRTVPAGRAVAQRPAARARVDEHATVTVTLSRGPAPVRVLDVTGYDSADARLTLGRAGLKVTVLTGPDPGATPGTIYKQSPSAGTRRHRGSTVTLYAAETPRWQSVTSFSAAGTSGGHSVVFRIYGQKWRIVYSMQYEGTCSFLFFSTFCSAPTARAVRVPGRQVATLGIGSGQTATITSGPGLYQVQVSRGGDSVRSTFTVQDYY
jgi:serine/threonine-protein kinase